MPTHLEERSETPLQVPGTVPRRRRRFRLDIGAAVAALAVIFAVAVIVDDDDETTSTTTTTSTETSLPASTETTAPTTASTTPPADVQTAVFPTDGNGYAEPVAATTAFALDLGFRDPVVGSFQQGDSRSGEVEVRPTADGPVTTVIVRQLGTAGQWFVLGSATASIQLDSPRALDAISSPVRLQGQSTAFEATVDVEIGQDATPQVVGEGFVMGGANGEMGPFDGTVSFSGVTSDHGSIRLRTISMEDGSTREASVIRVGFASATADTTVVQVFFHTGDGTDELAAFPRTVPATSAVLRAALTQLLAGPTGSERQAGARSWFSSATAGMFLDVTLGGRQAVVDFRDLRPIIPNASSSAGSAMLLAELDATVLQFDTVDSVVYRIDGDANMFYEWLQLSAPTDS